MAVLNAVFMCIFIFFAYLWETITAALRCTSKSVLSLVSSALRNVAHDSCLCENVLDRGTVILRINFIFLECMSANNVLWFLTPGENAIEMAENNA